MRFVLEEELDQIEDFQGQHILIADDNDLNLEVIKVILEDRGLLVDAVYDGEEAVSRYLQSPEHYYQMILLDINMSGIDGYETAERIRQAGRNDSEWVLIYAISANILQEHKNRARAIGMNGYITKPVDYTELFQIMHRKLKQQAEIVKCEDRGQEFE